MNQNQTASHWNPLESLGITQPRNNKGQTWNSAGDQKGLRSELELHKVNVS